jgi:hypothetical protein
MGCVGITAIPFSAWLGQEHGWALGVNMHQSERDTTLRIDLAPHARVLSKEQMWRASSILEVATSRIGIEVNDENAFVAQWPRAALGYQLLNHVMVDASIGMLHRRSAGQWERGGVFAIGVSGL